MWTESAFVCGKRGGTDCGDRIVVRDSFVALIDGVTPKGDLLWEEMEGDRYVAHLLEREILSLPGEVTAMQAITALNEGIRRAYEKRGLSYDRLEPTQRLMACVILYSHPRKEIWSFGDCQFRTKEGTFSRRKKIDLLLADLRSFYVQAERQREAWMGREGAQGREGGHSQEEKRYHPGKDIGREAILPFLERQLWLANTDSEFGYDVLDGGPIHADHVEVVDVSLQEWFILASDGYPRLFDTLEETERHLQSELALDPDCLFSLRGTKGIGAGACSFDDRSFLKVWPERSDERK